MKQKNIEFKDYNKIRLQKLLKLTLWNFETELNKLRTLKYPEF